jgi:ATP-binding cassette subfamily F protein 3
MILIQNLLKRFAGRVILNSVSYHFPAKARIALVGSNGAGKTTLLNILCELDEADSGGITKPKNCVLGYLPQEPSLTPAETILSECLTGADTINTVCEQRDEALRLMGENYSDELYARYEKLEMDFQNMGGYALESLAKEILSGLGFKNEQFALSPLILSGGWRMRLELAKILVKEPNFLILDEPTNHLDLPSMIWLENYLERFQGTLLFVSHDQELLNRLATMTIHLSQGNLEAYTGNFDAFLKQHELKKSQGTHAAKQLDLQAAHIEKFIERFRGKPSKAAQVRSRYKMLSRLQGLQEAVPSSSDEARVSIKMPMAQVSGKRVLFVKDATIGYPNLPLARKLSLPIERGQKVAIIGANGIGKSTLLKSIVGIIPFLEGTSEMGHNVLPGYFAQEQLDHLDGSLSAMDNVMLGNPGITAQEARRILGGFLIQGDDVFKPLKVMSGGEKSRVGLANLLGKKCNFLLLDEPTNHLDMLSIEMLSEALDEYEGTVLLISHNRQFINEVATHIFAMTHNGRSQLFEGNLDDYVTAAERLKFPNVLKGG